MFTLTVVGLAFLIISRGVRVVFCFGAIRYYEYLHKVEHSSACPEAIAQIAVYLVESLLYLYAATFQFYVHHWQSVNQNGHVVAIFICSALLFKLVYNLQAVVVYVCLVYQFYVLGQPVVQRQIQDIAFALYHLGFILYGHLFVRNHRQQSSPFGVAQLYVVQRFQLLAQVGK